MQPDDAASQKLHEVFQRHRSESASGGRGCAVFFGGLAFALLVGLAWSVHSAHMLDSMALLGWGAPAAGLLLLALGFGWGTVRDSRFETSEAYRAIIVRGSDAVWFYVRAAHVTTKHVTRVTRSTVSTTQHMEGAVFIGYRDGSSVAIPIDPALSAMALEAVAAKLPHCTIGYSPENEAAFRSQPGSLRRA